MVNNLREQEGTHLMAHSGPKKLNIRLCIVPVIQGEVPDVCVAAICNEGASANNSVAGCKGFALLMRPLKRMQA